MRPQIRYFWVQFNGLGAGADTNGPMAIAVIGGMISSTLLTLIVVPALHSLIVRDEVKV